MSDKFIELASNLSQLANLLRDRSVIDAKMAKLIQRPAERGHLGEYIASIIFDIELNRLANQNVIDGHFMSGVLKGRSVNVKWYGLQERIIDLHPDSCPDYFLVFTGPKSASVSSVGGKRPLVIDKVFLFAGPALINGLKKRGRAPGKASYVLNNLWDEAEIYPKSSPAMKLTKIQQKSLAMFGPHLISTLVESGPMVTIRE